MTEARHQETTVATDEELARASPGARLALFGWPGIGFMAAVAVVGAWYGATALLLLGALVAGSGLVARAWAALCLLGLGAERRLSGLRAFPGDRLTLEIRLDNAKPLPLSWVRAEQVLPSALLAVPVEEAEADPAIRPGPTADSARLTVETPLGWYRSATLSRELVCRKRGWYPLPPLRLASSDVFGLFVREREVRGAEAVIVYPRIHALADAGLPARYPLGSSRDPRRLFEDPSRPMGIRDYGPETPFKAIAWKATARTGQLQATILEPTVTLETLVCLAVDSFSGAAAEEDFENAVSVAASLAHQELGRRRPVGLYANGRQAPDGGAIMIPAGRQGDREMLILEALARLSRQPTAPFDGFLDSFLGRVGVGATLVVVAGSLGAAALARLEALNRRGRPVVLLLVGEGPTPQLSIACRRFALGAATGAAA